MPCCQVSWEDCRDLLWKPQPLLPLTLTELLPISGVLLYCIPANQEAQQTGTFLQCSSLHVSSKVRTLTFWGKKKSLPPGVGGGCFVVDTQWTHFHCTLLVQGNFTFLSLLLLSIENERTLNGQIVRRRRCPYSLSILHKSKRTCELVSNASLGLRVSSWRATVRMACSACSSVLPRSTYFGKTYFLCTLDWPVLAYLWVHKGTCSVVSWPR